MIHVGADGECLYVDLYMNYNEVHNHLHVDRFRFRTHTTHTSTPSNANNTLLALCQRTRASSWRALLHPL